jgi:rhomboid family GlyGly-CTERM serine protease
MRYGDRMDEPSRLRSLAIPAEAGTTNLPSTSLLIVLAAALVQLSPELASLLQYDRAALAEGQWWRIATCHLTHWSLDHLFWDAAALLFLGACCELANRSAMLRCVAVAALAIPLAIAWLMPELRYYRGLSGLDSALFVLLAGNLLRDTLAARRRDGVAIACALLLAFAAKTAFECLTGQTLFVDSSSATMTPIPLAHVIGGLLPAIQISRILSSCCWMNSSSSARLKRLSVAPMARTQLAPRALPHFRQPSASWPANRPAM